MFKKLFFLIITSLISTNFSWAQIVPLKKPSLSSEELNKKIILNTIKPLKKPSKVKIQKKGIKKAKDNSIYNFIKWRHLLTSGNQASFYDYQVFLNKNSDYPRISRVKYLAEHKLSTESVSPKKIIKWFGENDPLSGYGKMILGESHILIGDKNKGTRKEKERGSTE